MSKEIETLLHHLISENYDEASKIFHKFTVSKGREIYEKLMAEDDAEDIHQNKNELEAEEYYGNELGEDEEEEDADHVVDGMGDEDDMAATDDAVDDLDHTMDAGVEGEEHDVTIGELDAEFEKFKSLMDQYVAIQDGGEHVDGEEGDDAEVDGDADADDETYPEFAESVELHDIKYTPKEGELVGKDGSVQTNKVSPVPNHPAKDRAKLAHPVVVKSTEHNGYERETAPTTKTINIKPTNALGKFTNISKEGDKAAILNKPVGGTDTKSGSPISGKMVNESQKTKRPSK